MSNDAETAPAIANGVVYLSVGPQDIAFGEEGRLYAFDAAGVTHCSGSPKTCTPLWTATQPDTWWVQSPAVANGVVYLTYFGAKDLFGGFAGIRAFDATGTINCSGTPKTCSHLWSVVANPSVVPFRVVPGRCQRRRLCQQRDHLQVCAPVITDAKHEEPVGCAID